ncbi:DUF4349 domain-containing protein [Sphingomonas sp.]|uniref:DUF4349 domain-containing protein n=1 Tax=Sphingomonas sp. TaxID=28214 RepID=UPI001808DDFC|nr:DUF4349 domain-containing protein [Sphingomonas sp.]MBA3511167.1 DUF4349 domain-containing protein [Sphingomonas sp.]
MQTKIGLCLAASLAFVSCSGPGGEEATHEDLASPQVSPTAAPGVAFRFSYDYSLDDGMISKVQEAHAAACEKLGVARCRITGLRYQIDDEDRVSGMLQVKLDPRIARQFGKQATATVEQNDGKLVTAEFNGEDVGSQISTTQERQADLRARITEIERRLASLNAGDREATQLQAQLEQLRRELSEGRAQIAGGQQRLANTPMTFNYFGEGGIAGFDENPIEQSWRLMVESFVVMVSVLLKVIGALLPWAILLALLMLLWRSRPMLAVRSWWRRRMGNTDEQESGT